MKVLMIVPPLTQNERYGKLSDVGTLYPPLGLAYIASYIESKGHKVSVIDSEAMNYTFEDIYFKIKRIKPNVICMTSFCTISNRVIEVAGIAKKIDDNINIVLGGVNATLFPEEVIKPKEIDFVVFGEGEITIGELIEKLEKGEDNFEKINGLVWKSKEKIIKNKERELIKDLDVLPFPARHLFPMNRYYASANLRGKRSLNIMASRGCPFRCAYCSSHDTFGRTNRFRSPENILEEIEQLRDTYGVDGLQFYDETFTINRKKVIELCKLMIREKTNIQWTCFTRVNLVDKELLDIMNKAGCYQIFYGVESGVQRLLDILQKDITLEQIRKAFKLTREAKIETMASFMLAIPTETKEESFQTLKFAIEINPDYAQWQKTTPFPGNLLYDLCKKNGKILTEDYSKYTAWNEAVYVPNGRTKEEIEKTVDISFRKFYLRSSYLLKRIRAFRKLSLNNQYRLIKAGLKVFF